MSQHIFLSKGIIWPPVVKECKRFPQQPLIKHHVFLFLTFLIITAVWEKDIYIYNKVFTKDSVGNDANSASKRTWIFHKTCHSFLMLLYDEPASQRCVKVRTHEAPVDPSGQPLKYNTHQPRHGPRLMSRTRTYITIINIIIIIIIIIVVVIRIKEAAGVRRLQAKTSMWNMEIGYADVLKGPHTPPRLKPTANCLYPTITNELRRLPTPTPRGAISLLNIRGR